MEWTPIGLVAGLLLGVAAAVGGFGAFVIAAALGAIGLLVGRWLDGGIDLDEWVERTRPVGRTTRGRR